MNSDLIRSTTDFSTKVQDFGHIMSQKDRVINLYQNRTRSKPD